MTTKLKRATARSTGRGGKAGKKGKQGDKEQLQAWQCLVCEDTCDEEFANEPSIECVNCKCWSHRSCADLTRDAYSLLQNSHSLHWMCKGCTNGERNDLKKTRSDNKLDSILAMMQAMTNRFEGLEKKMIDPENLEEQIEEVVDRKLKEALEETQEKEKRKKNLLIVNMKESRSEDAEQRKRDDLQEIKRVLEPVIDLQVEDLSDPTRLGQIGGRRPRMLKVTVKTEEKKKEIIRKAQGINEGIENVTDRIFFNPDLTKKEREESKKLRDELKKRRNEGEKDLVIRNGKIVVQQSGPQGHPKTSRSPPKGNKDQQNQKVQNTQNQRSQPQTQESAHTKQNSGDSTNENAQSQSSSHGGASSSTQN